MQHSWNDDQPIYRQLQERVVELILEGAMAEGEPLPSVRQVASEYQINHLTVAKAYQELVDQGLVERRRGLGMYVLSGARARAGARERDRLLVLELPRLIERARRLDIGEAELVDNVKRIFKEVR